jgi:bifunctional non-homologous end joining protein LigD
MAFDCLSLDGVDLRARPLDERKRALAGLLRRRRGAIRYVDHFVGDGAAFFEETCRQGAEGVVAKLRRAPYEARRTRSWLKVRCGQRQELVICGWSEPRGSRIGLGALLLGVYGRDGGLDYAGRVGTGFDHADLAALRRRLDALATPTSPFATPLPAADRRGAHFVKPRLVAEIGFTEWTAQGRLRHPVFLGLREDKRAREVVRERAISRKAVQG